MIASLKGVVAFRGLKYLVVETGGVGYRVYMSDFDLGKAGKEGSDIALHIHHHVREDSMDLYGFFSRSELDFFESLISISGIGPRSALGILGVGPVDQLRRAIAAGDIRHLTKVSGIGKKTAEKIVLELKDKLSGGAEHATFTSGDADALEALVSLGYSQDEAREALRGVPSEITAVAARVQQALRTLGSSDA